MGKIRGMSFKSTPWGPQPPLWRDSPKSGDINVIATCWSTKLFNLLQKNDYVCTKFEDQLTKSLPIDGRYIILFKVKIHKNHVVGIRTVATGSEPSHHDGWSSASSIFF